MKTVRASFVIVLLLATACGRQPGSGQGDGSAEEAAIIAAGDGRPSVAHDPRAMTAIDVATGDLSGLDDYAGGRALAPPGDRPAPSGQAAASVPAQEIEGSVAAKDGVGQPGGAATTENTAADSDQASLPRGVDPAPAPTPQ